MYIYIIEKKYNNIVYSIYTIHTYIPSLNVEWLLDLLTMGTTNHLSSNRSMIHDGIELRINHLMVAYRQALN